MHDAEPHEVDAQRGGHGREQRHDDEGDLEEVDEAAEHEDQQVDRQQEAPHAAGKAEEQLLHPDMAVDAIEGEREDAAADEDEDDEAGEPRRRLQRIAERREVDAAARHGERQRARRPHGAALGGRRDAEEDGAQHQEDEGQRRHQRRRRRGAPGESRSELHLLVQQRHAIGEDGGQRGGPDARTLMHDGRTAASRRAPPTAAESSSSTRSDNGTSRQGAGSLGQGRHLLRPEDGEHADVKARKAR